MYILKNRKQGPPKSFGGAIHLVNVHLPEWESVISSDSVVNLYVVVLVSADLHRFHSVEGVLQPLAEESGEGKALTELVGTSRWTSGIDTGALV